MRRAYIIILAGALTLLAYTTAEANNVRIANNYCFSKGSFRWNVFIDEAPEVLNNIKCVVYTLYPTFPNPTRKLCDAPNSFFALEASGRSEFTLSVKVEWRNGTTTDESYALDLHSPERSQALLCSQQPPASTDPLLEKFRPVGLAFLSSSLVILDGRSGRLLQKQPTGVRILSNLSNVTAIDIVGAQLDASHKVIFAIDNLGSGWGQLIMYSDSGVRAHESWTSPQPTAREFTGIAADSVTRSVYLAAPSPARGDSQILRLDLSQGISKARLLSLGSISLPSSSAIVGPIAVDGSRSRLFAVDKYLGTLISVDLPVEGSPRIYSEPIPIPHSLQNPRALAVDAANDILYAIGGNKVWKLQVRGTSASMQQFGPPNTFRSPSALTIGMEGNVWVGDEGNHKVYEISPDGRVRSSLPASQRDTP